MLRACEASTESKDPFPACRTMNMEGSSHNDVKYVVETPDAPQTRLRIKGSFGCVAVRCPGGNFAQDDRSLVL